MPRHTASCRLSEDFKDFFAEKVDKIRRDISATEDEMTPELNDSFIEAEGEEHTPKETSGSTLNCSFDSFSTITSKDLGDLVSKMTNKFCCLDPIPTFLLKKSVDQLTPILLHILNTSITTGCFPTGMKKAVVKPTLKKRMLMLTA